MKFADLIWPGRVLIEMKSRGGKLEKHYDQLFYYWSHIVPKRPPFAILTTSVADEEPLAMSSHASKTKTF